MLAQVPEQTKDGYHEPFQKPKSNKITQKIHEISDT